MPKIHLKTFLEWNNAEEELPKRDVPVVVVVESPTQRFCAVSHRMSRGWSQIQAPAMVTHWAPLPKPPTFQ